ncbi:MAG: phosphoglyceromutase, partial [Thermoplasmata archaeon]
IPYFKKHILSDLQENKTVLVVAHGNSLRSIVMHIENISSSDIPNVEIPTGVPIMYVFDDKMNIKEKKFL